jgi:MFS family permease
MLDSASSQDDARASVDTGSYRYLVAGSLGLVYMLNFMDRQIMSILQEPIRAEFGLSDMQLGLLTGLAFVLFYTGFGIPVAWLADRFRRVPIVAVACGIWSVFTIACGFAQNFIQLTAARLMVGAGEAGGAPPSYSIISDYFAPRERGLGLAIFSLGVPLGSAIGAALGAWVAAHYGWRMAFVVVGAPGIAAALLLPLIVREPVRGRLDPCGAKAIKVSIIPAIRAFLTDRTLVLTSLAAGMSAFVGYALLAWNPSLLTRVKGMSLEYIAQYYSLILGVTGLVGTFAAGWLADVLARRDRRWYAWLPALAFALMIPGVVGAILAPGWVATLCWLSLPALLGTIYIAPALTVVQNTAPPERRTISSAILVFFCSLIGLGGGPVFLGTVSDLARTNMGDSSLLAGYAALLPAILLTILLHLLAAHSMRPKSQGRD